MPAKFTFQDYVKVLSDDSIERNRRIKEQILTNCGNALTQWADINYERLIQETDIVKYSSKVENIKNAFYAASNRGAEIYFGVVVLNNIRIVYRPNQDVEAFLNLVENRKAYDNLLYRYDVLPLIDSSTEGTFDYFLERNPEFENFPFRPIYDLRFRFFNIIVQGGYLICLLGCE